MAGSAYQNDTGTIPRLVAILTIGLVLGRAGAIPPARADDGDVFQQAINYVFTGRIDPPNGPQVIDRSACIVEMPDPKYNRLIRYYLGRFKMDQARFSTIYSGPQPHLEVDVAGDDVIVEYLSPDKKIVAQGYKTAQIALPGNVDRTQKALAIIFNDHCKTEKPKTPF